MVGIARFEREARRKQFCSPAPVADKKSGETANGSAALIPRGDLVGAEDGHGRGAAVDLGGDYR